jgi:uncharacterized protein with von Willebrand factor type A (vWA) domain
MFQLQETQETMAANRQYTFIGDKSGSMTTSDCPGGLSRWRAMQESAMAIADIAAQLDPGGGIDVYLFSSEFEYHSGVLNGGQVGEIFKNASPIGGTNLHLVLQQAFDVHFAGEDKTTILVVTDGEPSDQAAVVQCIVRATKKMTENGQDDSRLAVSFIQVGRDAGATRFLNILDEKLQELGADFDIVDTVTLETIEDGNLSLTQVLENAIENGKPGWLMPGNLLLMVAIAVALSD